MSQTKYVVKFITQFRKDYKLAMPTESVRMAIAIIIASYIIGSYFVDYAIVRKDRAPETFNPEEAGGANAAYAENRKRLMAQAEAFRQEARKEAGFEPHKEPIDIVP